MPQYIDEGFNPPREFWGAMTEAAACPKCHYQMNGTLFVWKLLDAPQDFECWKCGNRWSIAIPKHNHPMRDRIEKLIKAEHRFYRLRDQLRETVEILHGRT